MDDTDNPAFALGVRIMDSIPPELLAQVHQRFNTAAQDAAGRVRDRIDNDQE